MWRRHHNTADVVISCVWDEVIRQYVDVRMHGGSGGFVDGDGMDFIIPTG